MLSGIFHIMQNVVSNTFDDDILDYPALTPLPDELFQAILSFVPKGQLYPSLFVCKKWKQIINDSAFMATRVDVNRLIYGVVESKDQKTKAKIQAYKEIISRSYSLLFKGGARFKRLNGLLHPELISLELIAQRIKESDLENLPARLQHLTVHNCTIEKVNLQQLPKGLKSLSVQNNNPCPPPYGEDIFRPESDFDDIPDSLESLSIGSPYEVTSYIIERLPLGLKSLSFTSQKMGDSVFNNLNCKLEQLSFIRCMNISGLFLERFTSLTRLSFSNCCEVTDLTIAKLPIGIRILELEGCRKITGEGAKHLSRLTHLKMLSMRHLKIDDTHLDQLPVSVSQLSLIRLSDLDYLSLDWLKKKTTLKLLRVEQYEFNRMNCENLPPSLNSLSIRNSRQVDPYPYFFRLSGIEKCCNLRELKIQGMSIAQKDMHLLPTTLKSLNLIDCGLGDKHIEHLSRLVNLSTLNIRNSRVVTGKTFNFFPSSLTDLDIRYGDHIRNLNLSIFPKTLLKIQMSLYNLSGSGCCGESGVKALQKKYPYMRVILYT